ncbi:MAG: HlyD family type I secretion periplasmic adaptor subunit [Alphaproteobacteria bacterium]|nr:HlyD family type I secretion periplasmic adaptor subunit [Alphaproteobacteria bacterium]
MQAKPSPRRPNFPNGTPGTTTNTKRAMMMGFGLIVLCVGGFGVWSTTVPIAGAVVANGQVVVASKRKQIQHPTGGVIRTLKVEDGTLVKAGDVLVELEDADAADRFTRTRDSFHLAFASAARLRAEAADHDAPDVPEELTAAAKTQPAVKDILEGQRQLFAARRMEMRGQLSIIEEQQEQLKNELRGLESDRASAAQQIAMTSSELKVVDELYKKGYTTRTRVFSLRRDIAQLSGNSGRTTAMIARTRSAIIENDLKLMQARNQMQSVIQNELRDVEAKVPNLREQYRAARFAYERMTIRAPSAGVVFASKLTVGSVVRPGETVLEIVPAGDRMMVEVQLRPNDVDAVKIGLDTEIRFTGLSQRTTLPVMGRVTLVSADALQDPRTNAPYFVAHIDVPDSEIAKLKDVQLSPGMPAAVMIKTGDRTALAYLTQPLTDSINRAWRE